MGAIVQSLKTRCYLHNNQPLVVISEKSVIHCNNNLQIQDGACLVLSVLKKPKEEVRQAIIDAAKRAIGSVGGAAECAAKLTDLLPENEKITPQAVDKWLDNGIPPKRVLLMEKIQAREDRYGMRPDVFGDRP